MFKGSEIVRTLCLRKLVVEAICDIMVGNASYMHFVRTMEMPMIRHALKTGVPKKEILKIFNNIDKKMDFLFCFFERHNNFLAPLKLMQNI